VKRHIRTSLAVVIGLTLQFFFGGSGGWSTVYALEALLQWLR